MTVYVDHNYPQADALRTLAPNGDPIENVVVQVFTLVAFLAHNYTTPIGATTTDIEGRWVDPIALPDGQSWAVYFTKDYSFGPAHIEITT